MAAFTPVPHPPEALGRPSRKAATAALEAHLAVVKGGPLKGSLSDALQGAAGLGGQERRFVALATRELSRHQRLLDLCAKQLGRAPASQALIEDQVLVRYALWRWLYTGADAARVMVEVKLPGPLRPRSIRDDALERLMQGPRPALEVGDGLDRAATVHSFPRWLAEGIAADVPEAEADALLGALNREPALILRSRLPGGAAEAVERLAEEGVRAEALAESPSALRLLDAGGRVFETKLMKRGGLQVQDLGSQLIAELCRPERGFPGAAIADVCAGAAGKSIALADLVGPSGKVYAADASARRLKEGRARVAALKLRQVSFPQPVPIEQADAVLVDAPCSGTGSLAREPDMKWKLTRQKVEALVKTQAALLEDLGARMRPDAILVYATCSLLREEDEQIVEAAVGSGRFALEPAEALLGPRGAIFSGPYLRLFPHRSPGGGFFAARLRRLTAPEGAG